MVPAAGERTAGESGERAQTSTIGVTLVLGFALAGSVLILGFGITVVSDAQQTLNEERAQKTLTEFDSKAALVALGNTDTQRIAFAQHGKGFVVENGTGWMKIRIDNQTDSQGPKVLLNQSLGAVVYDNDGETELAYQGGGVWQHVGSNTLMVSPPEFHYRNGTLTLPVVNVSGDRTLEGSATVSHERTATAFPNTNNSSQTRQEFPSLNANKNFTNPLTEHEVTVTVHSAYYKGWGHYFEERTTGKVTYDHARNLVNLTLVTPLDKDTIVSATASLSASGDFIISGSAADSCTEKVYTNSYDSSEPGDYCSQTPGDEGDIVYGGTVDIDQGSGGSYIHGNVISGGTVYVKGSNGGGQPYVKGNINYTIDCVASGGPPSNTCVDRIDPPSAGSVNQIGGIDTVPKINSLVSSTVEAIAGDNDNGDAPISGNRLDFGASSPTDEVTLTAGDYYLDRIDFSGGTKITFDTDGGDVRLAVRGDVEMPSDTQMEVVGDGTVKVYVGGRASHSNGDDWTWDMNGDTDVTNAGTDSPQFRVYGKDDFSFRLDSGGSHRFVGAIFAPPGQSGTGEVLVSEGQVFGGILTGTTEISNNGAIHYDEALEDKKILSRSARVVKVTYLHVSVNRIEITS